MTSGSIASSLVEETEATFPETVDQTCKVENDDDKNFHQDLA